jgi:hypothetical protein
LNSFLDIPAHSFPPIYVEKSRLELELLDNPRVSYSAADVYEVMTNLTASGCGYINHKETVRKLGAAKVEEMIARNILHYHPVSSFPTNLDPKPLCNVLVPTGMPALRAMEFLLDENSDLKTAEISGPPRRSSWAASWLSGIMRLLRPSGEH